MKLGIVTYNIAKDWDLDTTVEMCNAVDIRGVEFRTTHAHGVEVSLTADQRAALGIGDGLVRLSVGLEDVEDIKSDLGQAMAGG